MQTDDGLPVVEALVPAPPSEFGSGEIPAELAAFNWAAALWGPLWALLNGLWAWVGLFALLLAGSIALMIWLHSTEPAPAAYVLNALGQTLFSVLFGFRANALAWRAAAAQRRVSPIAVERFAANQRKFVIAWFVLLVLYLPEAYFMVSDVMSGSLIQPPTLGIVTMYAVLASTWVVLRFQAQRSSR